MPTPLYIRYPAVYPGSTPTPPPAGDVHWKAPVANAAALPASGNSAGDARITLNTSFIYVWNGSAWVAEASGVTSPSAPINSVQYNNGGVFGGSGNFTFDGTNGASLGLFGFNQPSPAYPVDALSSTISITAPATVTITASDEDPTIPGVCTSSYDSAAEKQYDNDATSCTANGVCIGGAGGETDLTTCTNNGGTWYYNTFTPTAGYVMPVNGSTVTYTINSYYSPLNFYSATGTVQTLTLNFDTDTTSIMAIQNGAETGYTATGASYNYIVYAVYASGYRSQGSAFSTADNSDGLPFAWDLSWAVPLTGTPTQYLVRNTDSDTAQYTATTTITDDASWPAFSDPGLSDAAYTVSWSSVAGASSYHITGPLGYYAFYPTTSFFDTGIPYYNNSSPNPKGPNVSLPGMYNDGVVLFKNTLTNNGVDATLQVWCPGTSAYSQQWFDSNGNLRSYMDNQGTFTGNFSSISGNQTLSGALTTNGLILNTPGNTVNGSTSGSASLKQPMQGSADKKVIIHLAALLGTASFTCPSSFTYTPQIVTTNGPAAGVVTALSTSAVTVTGASTTGFIILEGF